MSLIISGIADGPLPNGLPKAIELYVTADIADLSIYGIGSANNGGGSDGEEFSFPAVTASAGDYIYISTETTQFAAFFGFSTDYTSSAASINGDDAIELFQNGTVIDQFGDLNVDGTGQDWEYLDGWAYRKAGTVASPTFSLQDWTFSSPNALDGETTNASAANPVPLGTFTGGGTGGPATGITINEIDADTPGTDQAEFIELYDGGVGGTSLDGLSLVLFNGSSDTAYRTIDLAGQTTDENGFFVIGSQSVANVDLVAFTSNGLQNGADAVALYSGTAPSAPTTDNLIDALVYDTNDGDDAGLLAALGLTAQIDEAGGGNKDSESLSRNVDGTGDFVTQAPTPGESNSPSEAPTITINEIDADTPGTDQAEFIELYDGGVGGTSLDGLSLVLFNGSSDTAYRTIDLAGQTTDENGFFVIGSQSVANVDLVAFTSNGLQNGADAVALYSGTAPSAPTTDNLIDALVYDTNDGDDAGLLAALGLTAQIDEAGGGNKDGESLSRNVDGTGDFVTQAPTPGETNVLPEPVEITKIHAIQGSNGTSAGDVVGTDDISAMNGSIVTVQAVVTADFQDGLLGSMGDLNGFYIQEEDTDADANSLTSEGIFIFDGFDPTVDVKFGDIVEVTGTVSEFSGQTQISATMVTVLDNNEALVPAATTVTFPTASIAITDDGNYVANLEAYEGMLVDISNTMTLTEMFNLDRFGQVTVNSEGREFQFTQNNAPDEVGYENHLQSVARSTIVIDDSSTAQNPDVIKVIDGNDGVLTADDEFRMGDELSNISGVMNYSFDAFRIHNASGDYSATNPREETPEDVGGNFKIASLNVLNYFTTIDLSGVTTDIGADPRGADSDAEFARQSSKIVDAIVAMDADVLGLVEIENDFAGADFAIKDLVGKVNDALGSDVYAWVDPGQEFVGGDAIANAIIYKQAEVKPLGDAAILTEFDGRNFLDPLDAGRDLNRAAIAQTFEDLGTGQTMTVSVNHLKSKGSLSGLEVDNDQGDGQGNNNATRTEAASILSDWLDSDPTGQGADSTLILGDLNAYAKEDPVTTLTDAGYTDLAASVLGDSAYSYVFDGQVGTLDYIMAKGSIVDSLSGVTEWHVNSDEPDAFDYNLDFGRDPALFNADTPARNSDHDPVIAGFDLEIKYNLIVGDDGRNVIQGTEGRDRIEAMNGVDSVFANGGDDLIIAGSGRMNSLRGGEGADTFEFSGSVAQDSARDFYFLVDFNADEDLIDLGGATIASSRAFGPWFELKLDGGADRILVRNVDTIDEIQFVDDLAII